jgi:hypothetical protein
MLLSGPVRALRTLSPLSLIAVGLLVAGTMGWGQPMDNGLRVVYDFSSNPGANCEIELTRDSLRVLSGYFLRGGASQGSPLDTEESRLVGRRVLTPGERDSAQAFMDLAARWTGYRRFVCRGGDSYAFSLWSDSLLLNCDNCFSCTEGVSMPDARVLARFGKMSLWLLGLRESASAR